MPQPPESNHTAGNDEDTGYCAVNAELVMQLFDMFQMRPSHFRASGQTGAHGVYYDARKIVGGRTDNRWGHHAPGALKSFCHFTQSENGTLVPWRELVEHQEAYDGKEGAGPRTGNRLRTENRLRLNHTAMAKARRQCGLPRKQLAEKTALPLRFISALEDGSWGTVTEDTARALAQALGVTEETLFTPLSTLQQPEVLKSPGRAPATATRASTSTRLMRILLLASVSGLLLWAGYQFVLPHQDSLFAGEYRGTFSGDDSGSWYITIDNGGAITGVSVSDTYGSNEISGSVPDSGQATISGGVDTSEFLGNFNRRGDVTGIWRDSSDGFTGTFTGKRAPVAPVNNGNFHSKP